MLFTSVNYTSDNFLPCVIVTGDEFIASAIDTKDYTLSWVSSIAVIARHNNIGDHLSPVTMTHVIFLTGNNNTNENLLLVSMPTPPSKP
jgi:hypothetical protein